MSQRLDESLHLGRQFVDAISSVYLFLFLFYYRESLSTTLTGRPWPRKCCRTFDERVILRPILERSFIIINLTIMLRTTERRRRYILSFLRLFEDNLYDYLILSSDGRVFRLPLNTRTTNALKVSSSTLNDYAKLFLISMVESKDRSLIYLCVVE